MRLLLGMLAGLYSAVRSAACNRPPRWAAERTPGRRRIDADAQRRHDQRFLKLLDDNLVRHTRLLRLLRDGQP